MAVLSGQAVQRDRPLYWHYYRALGVPKAAMRIGDWMILGHRSAGPKTPGRNVDAASMAVIAAEELTQFELYSLKADVTQQHDLAASEPQRLQEMRKTLVARHREVREEGVKWTFPAK